MYRPMVCLAGIVVAVTGWVIAESATAAGVPTHFAQLTRPVSPAGLQAPRPDRLASYNMQRDWRYRYYNGRWWYWTTGNRWVVWNNNRWNDYRPGMFRADDVVRRNVARAVPGRQVYRNRGPVYRQGYREGIQDSRRAARTGYGPRRFR